MVFYYIPEFYLKKLIRLFTIFHLVNLLDSFSFLKFLTCFNETTFINNLLTLMLIFQPQLKITLLIKSYQGAFILIRKIFKPIPVFIS
jgi:hypothetical protein